MVTTETRQDTRDVVSREQVLADKLTALTQERRYLEDEVRATKTRLQRLLHRLNYISRRQHLLRRRLEAARSTSAAGPCDSRS